MTPPVTPRPAATVMLLRDGPDLEVLLLRRSRATPFVPGAHVFPGGAVEPADADPSLLDVTDGLDEATASTILGSGPPSLSFWFAAVRECVEEAGIVLARHGDRDVCHDHPVFEELDELRPALERGERRLAELCDRHGLRLALDDVAYVARWITPASSPRRYDTRFFAARMPEDQHVVVDEWEAVEAGWWRPAEALAAWQAGAIELIEPTVACLTLLTELPSTDKALSALHDGARRPERIREPAGGTRVPLPSELPGDAR